MTQAREPLGIVDGGPPSLTFAIKSKKGVQVSRSLAILLAAIYVTSIVATGFLVYNFVACPHLNFPPNLGDSACDNGSLLDAVAEKTVNTSFLEIPVDVVDVEKPKPYVRLPRSISPIKYEIKLLPFIFEGNFTFNGNVSIVVKVLESTNNVTLHAMDLVISQTEILSLNDSGPNKNVKIVGYSNDTEKQFHIVHLKHNLTMGHLYQIDMSFVGKLNDDLHGFYRSSYKVNNTTRWIGTTQFQPTDARRAFPCFDEPAMKAKFSISIGHPKNMTAISNMDSTGIQEPVYDLPDYVWDHFKESLPMSTYLVAFVVSDFAHKSDGNFSVWARKDAIESANYALHVGPKILKHLEEFFQIKYPLPKVDMIALPDFNAGAMENWGLITFRETAMLYDEGVSAKIIKPRVATVVAHELAHQWFGNLVTPSWWSDLWLNEGFASYVEYVGVDAVEHSWKSMDQFVIHEVQNVFSLDALSSSHQISVEVGNPDEINEIFDKISYGKGATIIRMMYHFLTSEVFNKGVTNYLNSKKYQSAEQNDLWKALTDQARNDGVFDDTISVRTIMDTWTLLTGFPVVNVKRNYESNSIFLQQERFMLVMSEKNIMNNNLKEPLWWIPITYTFKSNADFKTTKPVEWMKGTKTLQLNQTNIPPNDWVIFNIQQTGFFRVNYDERNWKMIIDHLNDPKHFEEISIPNRAQILDDVLNLALGGRLSYSIALDTTKYLMHEKEFVPWKAGLAALGYIDSMLSKGPHYLEYQKYILSLIKGIYDEVGFIDRQDDEMLTIYKRIDVINIACLMEYEDCVKQAVTNFLNWMMSPNPDLHNPISPNLRNAVYCTAVRVGGAEQWHFIRERFLHTRSGSERELLLTALGCTRLPWLLTRYLDQSIRNDSGIRKQDVFRVFGAVSNSVIGQPIAFSFIRQNWGRIKNYLGSSFSNLNTIVKYSTKKLNTEYEMEELKKFSSDKKGELGRNIEQIIEKTEANIIWMNRNYDTIVKWLDNITKTS